MSEMQVSMRLSLQNLASGPLGEFADQLKALEPVAQSLNRALSGLSRRVGSLGDSAARGASGTSRLEAAMVALSDVMARMETKLAASSDSFAQLGLNAREAAAGAREAGSAIGNAAGRMDAAAVSTRNLTGNVYGLNDALKGMAQIWAGLKIEHGLKDAVKVAADMATLQAHIRAMGYSQGATKYATQQSWKASSEVPQVSAKDALGARVALLTATGQNNEKVINAALPQLLRNAVAYRANYNQSARLADIIGNMAGLAELRGMSQTPQGLIAASNQALQVAEATGGRMKIGAQEVVGRQTKYGAAQLLNEQGYKQLMAMAEQYTLAGHEGGGGGGRGVSQVGTAVSMLVKTMNAGKISKQTYEMLHAMGMWENGASALSTSTTGTATTGSLRGALEGQRNPLQWVHDVLVPRMLAYAKKNAKTYFPHGGLNNPQAELEAVNKVINQTFASTGGVNVANLVSMVMNPQVWGRIEESLQRANKAPTGKDAVSKLSPYTLAVQQFQSSISNLSNAIGTSILPVITPVIDFFANMAKGVGAAANALPGLTTALTLAAGAASVLLTVSGFTKLVGKLQDVIKWLFGFGSASKVAASENAASMTAIEGETAAGLGAATTATADGTKTMTAIWGTRLKGVLGMVGTFVKAIGIAFTLYEAGNSIKIAGVTINNHVEVWINELYGQFDRFFTWLNTSSDRVAASMFGALSGAANAVGATGIASWAKGHQIKLAASAHQFQMGYESRRLGRNLRAQDELSAQSQPGYERPAKGAPDMAKQIEDLQRKLADQLAKDVKGVPDLGAHGHAGRAAAHRPRLSPQQMADSWALQDLHRAGGDANRQNAQWQRQVDQAHNAVAGATAKDTPESIRAKWSQYASVLSAAGQGDLAAQALQHGDKLANQAQLQRAKRRLSGLQSDLANQTKLNAAQVTAGVLTPDQAQAKTLADQKAAAPQLLAAAEAVKRYEQALGQSTTAIDATITKTKELGNGLTQMQQKISNTVQGAFEGFFSAFMSGRKTWKQMGDQFVTSLLTGINSAVSQNLAQGFVQGLLGINTGTGKAVRGFSGSGGQMAGLGGVIGNLFSGGKSGGSPTGPILSGIGSLFSGSSVGAALQYGSGLGTQQSAMLAAQDAGLLGSSAASSSIASSATGSGGWMDAIGGWLANIGSSFAAGADTVPHDMVAQIHKGGMIVPASGAEAIRSGALGGSKQVHLTVHAMDSQSVMQALHGVAREASSLFGATSQNLNLGY
ncbi:MAG: hypothetical protein KGL42_07965 [Betaproteobacteria bacterium]|nr:hypothetical protein [Betaproteobacteria bacterium]